MSQSHNQSKKHPKPLYMWREMFAFHLIFGSKWGFKNTKMTFGTAPVAQRDANQIASRIKSAKFPMMKTLDQYDFASLPSLNKPKLLQLARGEFLQKAENIIFIGNSGTGKTHLSIALGVEACRNGYTAQFWTAAKICNELMEARTEKRLLQMENSG